MIRCFQNPIKNSVECSKSNFTSVLSHEFQKSFFHLCCRCSGKSYNQNRRSRYLPLIDHVCSSLHNNGSFPRAGACQDHHWSRQVSDRPKLRWISLHIYLLNFSIAAFTRLIVSSLPMISMISVAPAGVICLPETAVRRGHITYPFL